MRKWILSLVLGFSAVSGMSQSKRFSAADLQYDLAFLQKAVRKAHPVQWYEPSNKRLDSLLTAAAGLKDSLTHAQYRTWLGLALHEIGCIHTNISAMPADWPVIKRYFPNPLYTRNDSLWMLHQGEWLLVQEINAQNAQQLLAVGLRQFASDGQKRSFDEMYFHLYGREMVARILDYPTSYEVGCDSGLLRLSATDSLSQPLSKPETTFKLQRGKNGFYQRQDTAVLVIRSFSKKDRGFFETVFGLMEEQKVAALEIDLRGNGGGNRRAAAALASHVVTHPFGYELLLPKHRMHLRYYSGKGKLNYVLGRLKYGLAEMPFRRFSKNGAKRWVYRYQPQAKSYQGPVLLRVDGGTASSATLASSWLMQHGSVRVVGQMPGGGLMYNYGGIFPVVQMPKSKVVIGFPAMVVEVLDAEKWQAVRQTEEIPALSPYSLLRP